LCRSMSRNSVSEGFRMSRLADINSVSLHNSNDVEWIQETNSFC
jgi:hypothetical protein